MLPNVIKHACLVSILFLALFPSATQSKDTWREIDKSGKDSNVVAEQGSSLPGWDKSIDKYGNEIITKKESDGSILQIERDFGPTSNRIKVKRGNLYGYLDTSGKLVIPFRFKEVKVFHNGLNEVKRSSGCPWEVIDENGAVKYTLPADLAPYIHNRYWGVSKEGLLPVEKYQEGLRPFQQSGERGLYDLAKQKYLPVGKYIVITEFHDGLADYTQVNPMKTGFVNVNGQVVIQPQFDYAKPFNEGLAAVLKEHEWSYIDKTGKVAITLPKDCSNAESFSEGLAAVALGGEGKLPDFLDVRDGAKWGFIDKTGKVVIPALFYIDRTYGIASNAPKFQEGVAAVAVGNEVKHSYGYIDKLGSWIIQPQYKMASEFSNNKAKVCIGQTGFSREDWDNRHAGNVSRSIPFKLFLKQYELIAMSRKQVNELLGRADHKYLDSDIYTLNSSFCGNAYRGVEIHYENDTVTKYRYLSFGSHEKWIEKHVD